MDCVLNLKYIDQLSLVHIRCLCHSLQLAASKAVEETVSQHLDFIVSGTYYWFSRSCLRQQAYKKFYSLINHGHSPLKIINACSTRWLSIASAVNRISNQ